MFIWKIKNNIRGPNVMKSANKEHTPFEKQNEHFVLAGLQVKTFRRWLYL